MYKRQVYDRADSTKPNMGLTTWKNAPKGRSRKSDVTVAKNYLNETEMRNLNEIVTMYLDYAERQARRGNVMYLSLIHIYLPQYPVYRPLRLSAMYGWFLRGSLIL